VLNDKESVIVAFEFRRDLAVTHAKGHVTGSCAGKGEKEKGKKKRTL
jgi:hypothetical protein